ncbi:MAG TPA: hypothetical protein VKR57_06740 [Terriglobales bacterium]|nr:hypothetical protein [Terriglobales bacterium]
MFISPGSIAVGQDAPKIFVGTPQDVLTYHGDNFRTGWFSNETVLTASNVNQQSFGLLQVVPLDGRVDAEPLVALQQMIDNQGTHNVVYVATENNSVYALDADDGSLLWQRNFGPSVPDSYKSGDDNVFPVMGILGTPVIDRTAGALYVVADVYNGSSDAFQLHAIALSNGNDLGNPVTIQLSAKLLDGTTWTFNSQYQLQRAGLLEANGNIYVSFGSNGDINPNISRGTMVSYGTSTLKKVNGGVTDKLGANSSTYYLSSIWQSGYAPASDSSGDVYFATGNSDPSHPSYSVNGNRPESVIRVSGDLKTVRTTFTTYNYFNLDQGDSDLGSGGMLVLPDQAGNIPHLAVAGGKDGRAFLLNRDHLGGYTPGGPDKVVQTINMGGCWCGPAYFVGSDGVPRVVTGGGNGITSWKLQTSPSTQLILDSSTGSGAVNGLPDYGGSIPVISSNGTVAGSAVVWFVQRPATSSDENPGTPVTLNAFAGSDLSQELVSIQAGTWTHAVNSNANLVPTVANGKVYVASNLQLQIFGLISSRAGSKSAAPKPPAPSQPAVVTCSPEVAPLAAVQGTAMGVHQFRGAVCQVDGNQLRVALPGRRSISVDIAEAAAHHRTPVLTPGRPVKIRATIDEKGIAHALRISHSHAMPE